MSRDFRIELAVKRLECRQVANKHAVVFLFHCYHDLGCETCGSVDIWGEVTVIIGQGAQENRDDDAFTSFLYLCWSNNVFNWEFLNGNYAFRDILISINREILVCILVLPPGGKCLSIVATVTRCRQLSVIPGCGATQKVLRELPFVHGKFIIDEYVYMK